MVMLSGATFFSISSLAFPSSASTFFLAEGTRRARNIACYYENHETDASERDPVNKPIEEESTDGNGSDERTDEAYVMPVAETKSIGCDVGDYIADIAFASRLGRKPQHLPICRSL